MAVPFFFTLALDGGQWSSFHSAALPLGKEPPSTYWIGGWVGPTASLDAMERRRTLAVPGIEPWPSNPL
jgi:hypothetical protein